MAFFRIFDYTNGFIAVFWSVFVVAINVWGFIKKKSVYSLVALIFSVVSLLMHVCFKMVYAKAILLFDFIWLIASISVYLYIDEIESRRKVISEVFENKYVKSKRGKNESSNSKGFKFKFKNRK